MKFEIFPALRRDYPHVVIKGRRTNRRTNLIVSNEAVQRPAGPDDDVYIGEGMLDTRGHLAEAGRAAILDRMVTRARRSKARYCIVWGPASCTWIASDGTTRDGSRPPKGQCDDPYTYETQPVVVEWFWTIRLPDGCDASHLCVRRVDDSLVEIAIGEPITLADFGDNYDPNFPDPSEKLLDADGFLIPPATFRGQRVTGVVDDWRLKGPVQPFEVGLVLRNPWPEDVRSACEEVAGRALPVETTDKAWRALNPEDPAINYVGVLEVA